MRRSSLRRRRHVHSVELAHHLVKLLDHHLLQSKILKVACSLTRISGGELELTFELCDGLFVLGHHRILLLVSGELELTIELCDSLLVLGHRRILLLVSDEIRVPLTVSSIGRFDRTLVLTRCQEWAVVLVEIDHNLLLLLDSGVDLLRHRSSRGLVAASRHGEEFTYVSIKGRSDFDFN
ncbi:hypothetical protein T492DRAFT_68578, partial [Pavlovales sp. CCMP2436]